MFVLCWPSILLDVLPSWLSSTDTDLTVYQLRVSLGLLLVTHLVGKVHMLSYSRPLRNQSRAADEHGCADILTIWCLLRFYWGVERAVELPRWQMIIVYLATICSCLNLSGTSTTGIWPCL